MLLLGDFGGGNIGNEASLEAAVLELRRQSPKATFLLVCTEPDLARAVHRLPTRALRPVVPGLHRVPIRAVRGLVDAAAEPFRFVRAAWILLGADAVVVPGTGILDDFGVRAREMPLTLFTWTLAARAMRRPFVFSVVGAGPIDDRWSRMWLRAAAGLAARVSFRDSRSRLFMESLGRDVRGDAVRSDLAFAIPCPAAPPARSLGERGTVGLGVMSYGGWSGSTSGPQFEAYLRLMGEVIDGLLAREHRIQFMVGQPNDYKAVGVLVARSVARGVARDELSVREILDFRALLTAVGDTDCVIATRYHNVVAAIMMERPVISLSYAHKNASLLADLRAPMLDRHADVATAAWVLDALDSVAVRRSMIEVLVNPCVRRRWIHDIRDEVSDILRTTVTQRPPSK